MTLFNTVIPILKHLSSFSIWNSTVPHQNHALLGTSNVEPDVSQIKATLRNDVRFPTVYRRICCRKFVTKSNQISRYIRKCIRMGVNRQNRTIPSITLAGRLNDRSMEWLVIWLTVGPMDRLAIRQFYFRQSNNTTGSQIHRGRKVKRTPDRLLPGTRCLDDRRRGWLVDKATYLR